MPTRSARRLTLVTPDLFGAPNGIARIARALTLAMSRWASTHHTTLHVLALRDDDRHRDPRYLPQPHTYRGFQLDRPRFSLSLLREFAHPQPHLCVFTHPHLTVLGLAAPPWVKTALVSHGDEVWAPLSPLRRLALRRIHAHWPVSRDTGRHLAETQGVSPARIHPLLNALDPFWHLPTTPQRGARHLLTVTRLTPASSYKGVDRTLEALALLPPERRLPLLVVGDGPDRPRLEALATRLQVPATFAGSISDEALAQAYRDAQAFLLPSTGEGFGLVYLEAAAYGLPSLGAPVGGAPEVIADGTTGLLVPPTDLPALARAIERLSGPEGERMGQAARARLEREFLYARYEADVHAALTALL